jgi:hypothetical protein
MAAMLFCSISISAQTSDNLEINFVNHVGFKRLELDSVTYKNPLEQTFTVTNFKYYISNVKLIGVDDKVYEDKDSYYLIDEATLFSGSIKLHGVGHGWYKKIAFTIGVDSLHNCSGAQEGALDPAKGMFWAWNTGYIFMKLEGKSPSSKSPGRMFEYHIGGYREPSNCIRNVELDLNSPPGKNDKVSRVSIKADILKILSAKYKVDFSSLSSVTDFHNAVTIADNYKDMFTIMSVGYEK